MNEQEKQSKETPSLKNYWWLAAILIAGLGILAWTSVHQRSEVTRLQSEIQNLRADLAGLRQAEEVTKGDLQQALTELRGQVENSQLETKKTVAKAQAAAQFTAKKHTEAVSNAVKELEKQQIQVKESLTSELAKVKESTDEAASKLGGVSNEVATVKTDLASTREEVAKSVSELQRVRGDLGVMSGLIATNSKEIQALRELGERNIYEFTLAKSAGMQKVGDIQVKVNKLDQRRSRYTLIVVADDRSIEKKDKTINEPVQFYVASKARQPYEIVVNEVTKTSLRGYLSTPKTNMARNN